MIEEPINLKVMRSNKTNRHILQTPDPISELSISLFPYNSGTLLSVRLYRQNTEQSCQYSLVQRFWFIIL